MSNDERVDMIGDYERRQFEALDRGQVEGDDVSDLSEFLLARIAEDEEVLTRPEPMQHYSHGYDAAGTYSANCPTCRQMILGTKDRAIAECAFKRVIVQLWNETEEGTYGDQGPGVAAAAAYALALVYADHPDFDEAWRL